MSAVLLLALAAAQATAARPVDADSIRRLRDVARRAEVRFERLSRSMAPIRLGGGDGSRCDERIGRFCLIYDSGRLPDPAPEPVAVVDARRTAIEALRHAFSWLPGDFPTAAPLVRYLIEDDRAAEAVPAARLFFAESRDSLWGPLLVGFALHAAGRDTAAERYFAIALPRLEPAELRRIYSVEWLLGAADRGAYRKLDPAERRVFEERLWRMSDPLYLTPGNERRNEHLARHVWSRILSHTPVVQDMVRWGEDLVQLTVRYGIPNSRTRSPGWGTSRGSLTEHYDPDQLAWVPEDLLTGGPLPTPAPGEPWELEATRSRSGYAPVTVRRVRAMPHQVSRFPGPDGAVLRVDGVFLSDSAADGRTVMTGLRVLDGVFETVTDRAEDRRLDRDSLRFGFEAALATGEYVYSIEALDPEREAAARARYAVRIDTVGSGPMLSDPVITQPWRGAVPTGRSDPRFQPAAFLSFPAADTIGIYAEVAGLTPGSPFQVRLSLERGDRPSLAGRVVSWIGDKLGLHDPAPPPRLEWAATARPDGTGLLAVDLFLDPSDSGLKVVALQIVDPTTGKAADSRRTIRIGN